MSQRRRNFELLHQVWGAISHGKGTVETICEHTKLGPADVQDTLKRMIKKGGAIGADAQRVTDNTWGETA